MKQIHCYLWVQAEKNLSGLPKFSTIFPEIPPLKHATWQTDKTDTRLFCGLLRKICLRITIATEKNPMKLLKDEAPEKKQWKMQFHCLLI